MSHDAPAPGIGPWIQSFAGRRVTPLELEPEQVTICDVAHALGMAPRFAGHTCRPYSVGEHSIYVAEAVALDGMLQLTAPSVSLAQHLAGRLGDIAARLRCMHNFGGPELGRLAAAIVCHVAKQHGTRAARSLAYKVLRALVHDASEAYLADVPTPVKMRLPEYRATEHKAQAACVVALVPPNPDPAGAHADLAGLIKCADLGVLLVEKQRLLTVDMPDWSPGLPRDRYWACVAGAAVSLLPGSLSDWERRCYLPQDPPSPRNPPGAPTDPHSAQAVEDAFYQAHRFLCAVVQGKAAHDAAQEIADEVLL